MQTASVIEYRNKSDSKIDLQNKLQDALYVLCFKTSDDIFKVLFAINLNLSFQEPVKKYLSYITFSNPLSNIYTFQLGNICIFTEI